jgi:hypothetical protein
MLIPATDRNALTPGLECFVANYASSVNPTRKVT